MTAVSLAQRRTRDQSDAAGNHARLIAEDVAEHIFRHDHIKLGRIF